MSKFFNLPVAGIDVSADFSMVAILAPNGDVYRKPFKINHDAEGFDHLLKIMQKVEEEFAMKPTLFMESTGVYHLTLFHFLKNNELEAFVINPLVTNSNKNSGIRKVKNDKKDALSIAKIGKFQNVKMSDFWDVNIFAIRSLCRNYYNLVDNRSNYKKKLSAILRTLFPGYQTVFSDVTGIASKAILSKYMAPEALIDAPKEEVLDILKFNSHRSMTWCRDTYDKLLKAAYSAAKIGIRSDVFQMTLSATLKFIDFFDDQIEALVQQIKDTVKSDDTSKQFRDNVTLLLLFHGIGFITAVSIVSEMGDHKRFKCSKELVAFFGIDPSVNESGQFKSNRNKMSKRGSRYGRRALYAFALASIRNSKPGKPVNSVLYKYYTENLKGKKKKVAIGAIMHKLINYIFAALRDQKPYEVRDPKLHNQMYVCNQAKNIA